MGDTAAMQRIHIVERLRTDPILWLGTVRPDGRPHVVPVWFYWDGSTVLIVSQPRTQKIRNLRANPNVFLALDDTKAGDDVALVEGTAELLPEPTPALDLPGLFAKYAAPIAQFGWTPEGWAADYSQPIRVTPTRFLGW